MKKQSGISTVTILIAVVVLIGLGGGGYYLYSQNPNAAKSGGLIKNTLSNQKAETHEGRTYITGDDIKLPADYPADITVYPKSKIISTSFSDSSVNLQQTTSDDKNVIANWYKDLAKKNNWQTDLDYDDTMVGYYTLTFSKDDQIFGASIKPGEAEDGSTLIIFNSESKSAATKGMYGQDQTVGENYDDAMQKVIDLENRVGDDR